MSVTYKALALHYRDIFRKTHPRGREILQGIERDIVVDPLTRATKIPNSYEFAQIFTPPVQPAVELRFRYVMGENGVLITYFDAVADSGETDATKK